MSGSSFSAQDVSPSLGFAGFHRIPPRGFERRASRLRSIPQGETWKGENTGRYICNYFW